jgi:hypothetical protein
MVRSTSTGKYHTAWIIEGGQVRRDSNLSCGSQSRRARIGGKTGVAAAAPGDFAKADASAFCTKCFPNGKPAEFKCA